VELNKKRFENTQMRIERLAESNAIYWNQRGCRSRKQRRTRNENSLGRRSKIGQNNGLTFLEKLERVDTLKIT
jgi:hypothetical protein